RRQIGWDGAVLELDGVLQPGIEIGRIFCRLDGGDHAARQFDHGVFPVLRRAWNSRTTVVLPSVCNGPSATFTSATVAIGSSGAAAATGSVPLTGRPSAPGVRSQLRIM